MNRRRCLSDVRPGADLQQWHVRPGAASPSRRAEAAVRIGRRFTGVSLCA